MNQDWTFDSLLRAGLLRAAAEDAERVCREEEVEFSAEYQRFQEKFLKDPFRFARRKMRPVWKKVLQTAACILLAAALGLAGSPAARAGLVQWVRTIGDSSVSYDFYAGPTDRVPPDYEIGAVPEGYTEIEKSIDTSYCLTVYQNEEGQCITFQYMYMEEGIGLGIDMQGMETLDIEVNGCNGTFYFFPDGSDSNVLVWLDEQAGLLFNLDMWGTLDEILPTAESVYLTE